MDMPNDIRVTFCPKDDLFDMLAVRECTSQADPAHSDFSGEFPQHNVTLGFLAH